MSAALGPGDHVRCIDGSAHGRTGDALLVVGRIYRVTRLWGDELMLAGLPHHSWIAERFEPLGRRSFDHLLQPAPERVLEPI